MTETDEPYLFEHDQKVTTMNLKGEFDQKSKIL